jgi:hypothetical protein
MDTECKKARQTILKREAQVIPTQLDRKIKKGEQIRIDRKQVKIKKMTKRLHLCIRWTMDMDVNR